MKAHVCNVINISPDHKPLASLMNFELDNIDFETILVNLVNPSLLL
jgi:hypothetical protein